MYVVRRPVLKPQSTATATSSSAAAAATAGTELSRVYCWERRVERAVLQHQFECGWQSSIVGELTDVGGKGQQDVQLYRQL